MNQDQIEEKVRVISEEKLYPKAKNFFSDETGYLSNAQSSGLENMARNAGKLSDLESFLKKQQDKDSKHRNFYFQLTLQVNDLKAMLKEEGLVPEDLSRNKEREMVDEYGILLAREFLFHLISQNSYELSK